MISYKEALARVLADAPPTATTRVDLKSLGGRVIAPPVVSEVDLPLFDNSAMDGYAVQTPVSAELEVIGTVAAGDFPELVNVGRGQTARIFTGAAIPQGADAVMKQEDATVRNGLVTCLAQVKPGDYIRKRGEELRSGALLIERPTIATPAVISMLASAGIRDIQAAQRPRVTVIESGSELVLDRRTKMRDGLVYAANGFALASACGALGCKIRSLQCGDDPAEVRDCLSRYATDSDVLITTGGVSVGDYDFVRPALKAIGIEERFWGVAIRPGKPTYFGVGPGGLLVFGLPGNPVSALVTFFLFARPCLRRMQGLLPEPEIQVKISQPMRPAEGVDNFVRVSLSEQDGETFAEPLDRQGSHMTSSLAFADALLHLPPGRERLDAGSTLPAVPLHWAL